MKNENTKISVVFVNKERFAQRMHVQFIISACLLLACLFIRFFPSKRKEVLKIGGG